MSRLFLKALTLSTFLHLFVVFVPLVQVSTTKSKTHAPLLLRYEPNQIKTSSAIPKNKGVFHQTPEETSATALLSDPQTGKIFSPYFQKVKESIQRMAQHHKQFVLKEKGGVKIDFVLGRSGKVMALTATPDETGKGNPLMISRALQIIQDAEPFPGFPTEIQVESISFNITLIFSGTS